MGMRRRAESRDRLVMALVVVVEIGAERIRSEPERWRREVRPKKATGLESKDATGSRVRMNDGRTTAGDGRRVV